MTDTPTPDEPGWGWVDTVRVFYPYFSVLVFGPVCLTFGWHWAALVFTTAGAFVVAKWFWYRSCVSLPLLVWNTVEAMLAFSFIVRDWRGRLPAPPEVVL
jgi:hypothetical protein